MTVIPPTRGYATQPRYGLITSIELGQQTVIGFAAPHSFVIGENIGLRVPRQYGTVELNNLEGHIIAITTDTVTVNLVSANYTTFIYPVAFPVAIAMAVPSTSGIYPGSIPATVILNDAFTNVRT